MRSHPKQWLLFYGPALAGLFALGIAWLLWPKK